MSRFTQPSSVCWWIRIFPLLVLCSLGSQAKQGSGPMPDGKTITRQIRDKSVQFMDDKGRIVREIMAGNHENPFYSKETVNNRDKTRIYEVQKLRYAVYLSSGLIVVETELSFLKMFDGQPAQENSETSVTSTIEYIDRDGSTRWMHTMDYGWEILSVVASDSGHRVSVVAGASNGSDEVTATPRVYMFDATGTQLLVYPKQSTEPCRVTDSGHRLLQNGRYISAVCLSRSRHTLLINSDRQLYAVLAKEIHITDIDAAETIISSQKSGPSIKMAELSWNAL